MNAQTDDRPDAVAGQVQRSVRPLLRKVKGRRVVGDKREPPQRMTVHWVPAANGRMYWCRCMPCFRVGKAVHVPAVKKTPEGLRLKRLSFLAELLAHG